MNASPQRSFACLEEGSSLVRPEAVWRRELGLEFEGFRAAFLRGRPETAQSYPCPRACGCAHEVIQHGPGDLVAVCRCERWNCDDIVLTAAEIACWELSWSNFGRTLCGALSLEVKPVELGLPNTRQIGAWSATAVPVILVIHPQASLFREGILELVSRLHSPFILLAPTSRHLTAPCLELLGRVGAGFFDLQSSVRMLPSGLLQPIRTPGELFMRFTSDPAVEDQSVLQHAFALAKALETESPLDQPTALAVFHAYCQEGLRVTEIARRFRCSRGTVMNRLKLIAQRTGMEPDRLRQLSPQIARVEEELSDSRAARIYRHNLDE